MTDPNEFMARASCRKAGFNPDEMVWGVRGEKLVYRPRYWFWLLLVQIALEEEAEGERV